MNNTRASKLSQDLKKTLSHKLIEVQLWVSRAADTTFFLKRVKKNRRRRRLWVVVVVVVVFTLKLVIVIVVEEAEGVFRSRITKGWWYSKITIPIHDDLPLFLSFFSFFSLLCTLVISISSQRAKNKIRQTQMPLSNIYDEPCRLVLEWGYMDHLEKEGVRRERESEWEW